MSNKNRKEERLLVCVGCRQIAISLEAGYCFTCALKKKTASEKQDSRDEEYNEYLRKQKGVRDDKEDAE